MNTALCCTKCGEVVFKSMETGTKLRAKVLIFKNDEAIAICKGCGTEIPVPLTINETMLKSMGSSKRLKLWVNK